MIEARYSKFSSYSDKLILRRILRSASSLEEFDCDFGYFRFEAEEGWQLLSGLKKLTIRNLDGSEAVKLIGGLPALTELVVRLVLYVRL